MRQKNKSNKGFPFVTLIDSIFVYDAAVKLVNGETLESDTFYMPTFGVGPDELEAKSDEIWTVKYADMLG